MMNSLRRYPRLGQFVSLTSERLHAIAQWLNRAFIFKLIVRTAKEMMADDATHMAAGVAYYALFSLFPLLLGLTAVLGYFVESAEVQSQLTSLVTRLLPGSEELVDSNLETVIRLRGTLGIFAIVGLLWSGSAVFGAVNRAINRAWDIHKDRPVYVGKPRQLLIALTVGILFMISMSSASFVRVVERLSESDVLGMGLLYETMGRLLLQGISFVVTLCIFLFIYKFMPNTKTHWRYIWPGAIVASVLFESAKTIFILYVDRIANFESIYGSLAPVVGLLLWVYLSSLILIMGAELSSEYGRLRRGVARGVPMLSVESSERVRLD